MLIADGLSDYVMEKKPVLNWVRLNGDCVENTSSVPTIRFSTVCQVFAPTSFRPTNYEGVSYLTHIAYNQLANLLNEYMQGSGKDFRFSVLDGSFVMMDNETYQVANQPEDPYLLFSRQIKKEIDPAKIHPIVDSITRQDISLQKLEEKIMQLMPD